MMELDELDKNILNLLQEDGRMEYSKIAKELDKPVSTIFERVKKLENNDVIEGYSAQVNPEKVGKEFTAFLLGKAELTEDNDFNRVGEELSSIKGVKEVYFITGDYDYLIKLKVKNKEEYYKSVREIGKGVLFRGKGMVVHKIFKRESSYDL